MDETLKIEFCGIGDEAGSILLQQIQTHQILNWRQIELRTVDGIAIADLDDTAFEELSRKLDDAGLQVVAISSRIGSWDRPITAPFAQDLHELRCLVERMQRLKTRILRIMSYSNDGLSQDRWRGESLERIAQLTEIAAQYDIVLAHENCTGWASQGFQHTIDLLQTIQNPSLAALFDIGNPVYYGYDGVEYLKKILPWVIHVHVKDAKRLPDGEVIFTHPGEGEAQVIECMRILLGGGYRGLWSIEPHLHAIPHLGIKGNPDLLKQSYIEYGYRLQKLVQQHI